jgi:hypothetical protein
VSKEVTALVYLFLPCQGRKPYQMNIGVFCVLGLSYPTR